MSKFVLVFVVSFVTISNLVSCSILLHPIDAIHYQDRPDPKLRIIGGHDVKGNIFPWMVSIVHYGGHHCGGSIINPKTILTAAHCTLLLNLRFVRIRVGSIYRSSGGYLIPVENVKVHENFNFGTMDYDIGIFRLAEELKFNDKIKPILLQNSGSVVKDGTKAVVTGWGALTPQGLYPEILQYLQIDVMNNTGCIEYMGHTITERMLCAGYLYGGKDACNLDSGGPLFTKDSKLIGLVSWGYGCASVNHLGVYTNISALRSWVEDTLFADYGEVLPNSLDEV